MYINNKSKYSLLNATTSVDEIIKFATENNLPAIGLCDVNSMQGFYEFLTKTKNKGVKAILAVDTFVSYGAHEQKVILIIKNKASLYEVNKLMSVRSAIEYEALTHTIVIFKDKVKTLKEGDYIGITESDILDQNFIIENNMILIDSTYFNHKKDYEFYKIVNCIRLNQPLNKYKGKNKSNKYLKLYDHTVKPYSKLYQNYIELVAKIEQININYDYKMPVYINDKQISNEKYLYMLAQKGMQKRLNKKNALYTKRLNYEFEVICKLGFVDYFLIVYDIIKYCITNDIAVGPGRGSAAGSLIAYCIGITHVDPVKYELLFERFLNPMRKTMPDIDIDVDDSKREQVVNYLITKYGDDHVCKIGTLSTFQAKASFKEVAKVIGVENSKISKISSLFDSSLSVKQNLLSNKDIKKLFINDSKLNFITDYIYQIENSPKNKSIHASGVIITDKPIFNYTSVYNSVSEIDAATLEELGLVKFDILSLANLNHLHAIEKMIEHKYAHKHNYNSLDVCQSDVYKAISNGYTNFVFQLESPGMMNTLCKFKPQNFDELAVILALYRPGPMQFIDEYIKRKNGHANIDYIDSSLTEILKPTYGIIVYQEQIMKIVQVLAGYNLGQADMFRRAISKKDKNILATELDKFKAACIDNNYSLKVVDKASERILAFANYGFNKSHAYSYAKIAYALMYYKVKYPDVYYSFYLKILKSLNQMVKLEQDIKHFNIKLLSPSIHNICLDSNLIEGNIQLGLNNIIGLNSRFKDALITYLETNNDDVIKIINECVIPAKLNDNEIENLVMSGIFRKFEYNEKTLIQYIKNKDEFQDVDALAFLEVNSNITKVDNYPLKQLEIMEKNALHLNLRYNSFELYYQKYKIQYPNIKLIDEVNTINIYNQFDTIVKITEIKEIRTKNNELMAFIECQQQSFSYDIRVFPQSYKRFYDKITKGYGFVNLKSMKNMQFSLENIKMIEEEDESSKT